MSSYPLIEALGVKVINSDYKPLVSAADLEAALAKAPVVGLIEGYENTWNGKCVENAKAVATARLVCVEPIVKDTAESLLRELINCPKWEGPFIDLQERARRLLEGK